jgi:ABC-type antimicrobial peptide transport system permease subunit
VTATTAGLARPSSFAQDARRPATDVPMKKKTKWLLAMVALILTMVGLYGVMSCAVSENTRQIGIRMALGAQRRDVLTVVLGQGMRLTIVGVVIGIAAALAVTRLMSSLLFGVGSTDPWTFAGVAVLLLCVAAAACYLPARRAMNVDPMIALRQE